MDRVNAALDEFLFNVKEFANRVILKLGAHLESILYYPHPFGLGGLVVLLKDSTKDILGCVEDIYSSAHFNISLHCLRRAELFKLSLPGIFSAPNIVSENLHLSFWLKNKGVVLYGVDIRDEVLLPTNLSQLLDLHLEACFHSVRGYYVIQWLIAKEYAGLVKELDRQLRYLMATSLLVDSIWDISLETVPEHFQNLYTDKQMKEIWQEFSLLYHEIDTVKEVNQRQIAFESVWLFENFVKHLKESVLWR